MWNSVVDDLIDQEGNAGDSHWLDFGGPLVPRVTKSACRLQPAKDASTLNDMRRLVFGVFGLHAVVWVWVSQYESMQYDEFQPLL